MTITNRNLNPGTTLVAKYRGQECSAYIESDGTIRLVKPAPKDHDVAVFKSLSKAANAITGNSVNGWRFWSVFAESEPAGEPHVERTDYSAPAPDVVDAFEGPNGEAGGNDYRDTKTVKVIKRTANQRGLPASQVRYFCSACMAGFIFPEGPAPETCPEGHAATRPA